jgi:uncharacterized protein (TIGR02246 family)
MGMKRMTAILVFVLVRAGLAYGQGGSSPDEAAVRAIVNHWQQHWEKLDAALLDGDYAPDAELLNAFGVRLKGSENILSFMAQVVKRPNMQGRQTTWDAPSIRFLRTDVAIASRDYRTRNHPTLNGQQMPERHTHCTWVLTKDDGKWRIASQIISDDNQ